jgi:3-hydroxyacyl-[acyl-carrier-protein] dehydratase
MSSPRPHTLEQIKVLLRRDLKLGPDIPIPDDMPFSGTEADFDSLDILLLLTSIEKEFNVRIPSEAVGKEVFRNVSTLAAYIDQQMKQANEKPDYLARLPHRDPFRFISRINEIRQGDHGEGVWELSGSEPFFAGHFPGQPLVPGVLIAEALAQLSGLVGPGNATHGKLAHIDIRFEKPVTPPAQIILRSKVVRALGELAQFEVTALLGDTAVARGMLTLSRQGGEKIPGTAL